MNSNQSLPVFEWTVTLSHMPLNADIEAGLIDVAVVYRLDRLSRALMDVSKPVTSKRHVPPCQRAIATPRVGRRPTEIMMWRCADRVVQ